MQTDAPAPGTQLGRYQLTELQGQGGFAWVYHARREDGKSFAVKVLKHRYGSTPPSKPVSGGRPLSQQGYDTPT